MSLNAMVLERLTRALGVETGGRYAAEAMQHLRLDAIRTPDDLLRIADHLIAKGGVAEAVGRAFRITAILRGAGR